MADITVSATIADFMDSADATAARAAIAAGTVATEASTLALLAGATITPTALVIPQFGVSQVPANRAIGINQAGHLAIGDGTTIQGGVVIPPPTFDVVRAYIATVGGTTLSSLAIPSAQVIPGQEIAFELDLAYKTGDAGGGNIGDIALVIDFATAAVNDATKGIVVLLPWDSTGQLKGEGTIYLEDGGSSDVYLEQRTDYKVILSRGSGTLSTGSTYPSMDGFLPAVVFKETPLTATLGELGEIPINVANTVRIRVVSFLNGRATSGTVLISGKCSLKLI